MSRSTHLFGLETSQRLRMEEVNSTQLATLERAQWYGGPLSPPANTGWTLLSVKFKQRWQGWPR